MNVTPTCIRRARHPERGGIISKFVGLVFLVALLAVVYIARHPLLRLCGRIWIEDENPVRSDAIIILGDDNYNGDRAARAAQLLEAGWAPRIVASGRFLRSYASVADLMEHDLRDRGVPQDAILKVTHRAENTKEEVDVLRRVAVDKHWRKVLIVTSNYHTRRTAYISERMFPSDIEVRVIAAPDADYNPDTWWQSRLGLKLFFHELVGYVVAMWEVRRTGPSESAAVMPVLGLRFLFAQAIPRVPDRRLIDTFAFTLPVACTIFRVRAWLAPSLDSAPSPVRVRG